MKNFKEWLMDNYNEELPSSTIDSGWFAYHGLPMVVSCYNCVETMALPSAFIDDNNYCYCENCSKSK
jgi:hypothetical protein